MSEENKSFPLPLNADQETVIKEWAADSSHSDLWGNDEVREINLRTFARSILSKAVPSPKPSAVQASVEGEATKTLAAIRETLHEHCNGVTAAPVIHRILVASLLRVAQAVQDSGDTAFWAKDDRLVDYAVSHSGIKETASDDVKAVLQKGRQAGLIWELARRIEKTRGTVVDQYVFLDVVVGLLTEFTEKIIPPPPGKSNSVVAQAVAQQDGKRKATHDLLDWAESLICNAIPMSHCTQEEWDKAVQAWRDNKHTLFPDGPREIAVQQDEKQNLGEQEGQS